MTADGETTTSTVLKSDADLERPTSDESTSRNGEDELDVIASHRSAAPVLTLSKARAIALVATVTGASFLNVRKPLSSLLFYAPGN